jgi:hypothetical protein
MRKHHSPIRARQWRRLLRLTVRVSPTFSETSVLWRTFDPGDPTEPAPPPLDDEEQANLRALDAKLSSTGNIRDAVALYNARRAHRASTFIG